MLEFSFTFSSLSIVFQFCSTLKEFKGKDNIGGNFYLETKSEATQDGSCCVLSCSLRAVNPASSGRPLSSLLLLSKRSARVLMTQLGPLTAAASNWDAFLSAGLFICHLSSWFILNLKKKKDNDTSENYKFICECRFPLEMSNLPWHFFSPAGFWALISDDIVWALAAASFTRRTTEGIPT